MNIDFPNLLLIGIIVSLLLTVLFTKVMYHHDVTCSYVTEEGSEMIQFFIYSFEKDIPWTVFKDASSVFLSQNDLPYVQGSEIVIGSHSVALRRVFHPFWRDSKMVVQELSDKDLI